jgi:hypothetical protein
MASPPLCVETDWIADGVARVAFSGTLADGRQHWHQVASFFREFFAQNNPRGLVVDLRDLIYPITCGDSICPFFVCPKSRLLLGRRCVVASGQTAANMQWVRDARLDKISPIFCTIEEAIEYVNRDTGASVNGG